jgi:hypothetical protein
MDPLPKLTKVAARVLQERLRAYWEMLKARFAAQSEEDLVRAEQGILGRNERD